MNSSILRLKLTVLEEVDVASWAKNKANLNVP